MGSGYCNHCKQNVLLQRGEFDVCLAIILLLFTAGIGFIIYLVIYYNKPENRCVQCGNRIPFINSSQYMQQDFQVKREMQEGQVNSFQEETSFEEGTKFCSFCGEKISSETIYCPNCGSRN